MGSMGKVFDSLSSKYKNFLIIEDFHAQASYFCDIYSFKHLIKEPTCYEYPINPKCIDLMITNKPHT